MKTCRICSSSFDETGRPPGLRDVCRDCESEVSLARGDMIWNHKTAPVLQIRGRAPAISPEEHARMRRR